MKIKEFRNAPVPFLIAGLLFIFLSAAIAYLENHFSILGIIVLFVGLIFSFSAIFFLREKIKSLLFILRLAKPGSSILFVFVLVFLLIGVNDVGRKYSFRYDMTKAKQHTLTKATVDIIKNLKKDVKITTFYVGIAPNYLKDLLDEYERLSQGHIKKEIVDPLVQIGYAAQFGNVISADEKKAVVESGKERKDIDFKDKSLNEEMLTNAIIKTTRDVRKVYFLTGHEEFAIENTNTTGYSILKDTLTESNYIVKELMLGMEGKIPSDCDVLVIAGPKNPLLKKEEDIIEEYLERGGKALFLIESAPMGTSEHPLLERDKLKNPSLNEILNNWRIAIGDDLVVDLENYIGGDVGCPATKNYPPHKEIVNNLDYTFYVRPRSITFLTDSRKSIKIAPLVMTASKKSSWAEEDRALHVKFDEGIDKPGPVVIGAVIWEPKNDKKIADTKIIVFTDSDFASNAFIGQYSNAEMILNCISWLSDLEKVIPIKDKDLHVERLDLTSRQIRLVVIILVAIPILIVCGGCLVWWRQGLAMLPESTS